MISFLRFLVTKSDFKDEAGNKQTGKKKGAESPGGTRKKEEGASETSVSVKEAASLNAGHAFISE